MDKYTLGILITTMNDGINRIKKEVIPRLEKIVDEIVVSHQITDENIKPEENILGEKVKYFFMYDKGLSKNRNNALKYSTTDICYISDDDLIYLEGFEKIIKNAYNNSNADIISFQLLNKENKHALNLKKDFKHNYLSIFKVCSASITFKRESIVKNNILFDENFGLGSKYPIGEEQIFLTDSIKNKLNLIHINQAIVKHEELSTGGILTDEIILSKGPLFRRCFGVFLGLIYPIGTIFFYLKNRKIYRKYGYGFLRIVRLCFRSIWLGVFRI